jgi:hypothetical protein
MVCSSFWDEPPTATSISEPDASATSPSTPTDTSTVVEAAATELTGGDPTDIDQPTATSQQDASATSPQAPTTTVTTIEAAATDLTGGDTTIPQPTTTSQPDTLATSPPAPTTTATIIEAAATSRTDAPTTTAVGVQAVAATPLPANIGIPSGLRRRLVHYLVYLRRDQVPTIMDAYRRLLALDRDNGFFTFPATFAELERPAARRPLAELPVPTSIHHAQCYFAIWTCFRQQENPLVIFPGRGVLLRAWRRFTATPFMSSVADAVAQVLYGRRRGRHFNNLAEHTQI